MQGISTKIQCGGPCATALVAMSKLGIQAEYMGTVGDDTYGKFIFEKFREYGVGTKHVRVIKNAITFHSFVVLNTANS